MTFDHGQKAVETIDGLRIVKAYKPEAGFPIIRFFSRWLALNFAMRKVDADVYYQRGAAAETGQVGLWCRYQRKKFVFGLASEMDCAAKSFLMTNFRERYLYLLGLKLADIVIAQTKQQQDLLELNHSKASHILRNSGAMEEVSDSWPNRENREILWIGRISPEKRFEWLLDLAERCGYLKFVVVGAGNYQTDYERELLERADSLDNVQLIGRVAYSEISLYYKRCFMLCSTSPYEGFPNVYLEAWQMGIPVLAAYDPDGVIAARGLGWICSSVEEMASVLSDIEEDAGPWEQASKKTKKQYLSSHTLQTNMPVFESYITKALEPV